MAYIGTTPTDAPLSVSQLDSGVQSLLGGFKNRIINGNFDLWQRGTSLGAAAANRYLADRWITQAAGSTVAPSQQSFTLGQTVVPGEPTFFHRSVVASSAGAGNFANKVNRIENVRTFAGQTATLSFWAKADATKNMAVEFSQVFGTGGSPSASVTGIGVTTIPLTTTFQKFTVTATMPSISGATLGTNGDSFLGVTFWFDAGSTFNSRTNSLGQQSGTFDIAQVQLEPGTVATSFEQRPLVQELAMAQRYYSKSFAITTTPAQNAGTTGILGYTVTNAGAVRTSREITFPVRMRASPTMTFFNPSAANSNWRNFSLAADSGVSSISNFNVNERSTYVDNPQVAGDAVAHVMGLHWTADAEL